MLSAAVLSSVGLAQMASRFDLTGSASLGNSQFASAPGTTGSGNVRALGWQTSGTSHFTRWLGLTSHFSAGYASANAIQLIGYSGAGKVNHYSMMAGPRITFASRSRFNPFIEGLGGTDYATTKFTSNGAVVTGRELQSAYAFGGGAQIHISRRVGLNVEGHYFDTQHSVAILGWTPSHLQISAGLVFRLSNLRDRRIIVDQQPAPVPSPTTDTQTASAEPVVVTAPASAAPVTTMVATAPAPSVEPAPAPRVEPAPAPRPQPVIQAATESQPVHQQTVVASQPVVAPSQPTTPPTVAQFQPSVVNPAAVLSQSRAAQAQPPLQTQAPAQTQAPVQTQAPQAQPAATARPVVSSYSAPAAAVPQAQPQQSAAPLSLGEYARRLREKKQHQQQ
ncbi:MAG: hypothetical protein DMG60_09760 [Acidobacteria bacterium]|nr:MAG: hypothetical protein DMG60_09760 [Acidobacteriota bacterium]